MIALKISVFGKVQGVFFRVSTKEKAEELGVRGWVRNEPDGAVFIHAQGESNSMDQFIRWCKNGPVNARVKDVVIEEAPISACMDFQVVY